MEKSKIDLNKLLPEKLQNSKNYPRIFGALGEDLVCKIFNLR